MMRPQAIPSNRPLATESYEAFEARLIRALGATVGGEALSRALGYPSQDAFRKAHHRDRVPVATCEVAGRRGRFAAVVDIAAWLWRKRGGNSHPAEPHAEVHTIPIAEARLFFELQNGDALEFTK